LISAVIAQDRATGGVGLEKGKHRTKAAAARLFRRFNDDEFAGDSEADIRPGARTALESTIRKIIEGIVASE
jgi:hypothetical protein